jgi:hypothetical protein
MAWPNNNLKKETKTNNNKQEQTENYW